MQVIVDTLLTNYLAVGNGKKVALFLHGWADSAKTFDSLAQEFIKENPNYTVVSLDLPGFGGTQPPSEPWGLDGYAQFVHRFLDKTKLEPSIILGHSNGGAIAISGISSGVLRANALILVASAGIRPKTSRNRALKIAAAPVKLMLSVAPKPTQRKIKQKVYGAIGSDYMVAEHMQETFKKVVSTDVTAQAKKITIPTCLIYGEDDTATPPHYGEQLKLVMPNAQLNVLPATGHFVHQEQVYKVVTILSEFIASV